MKKTPFVVLKDAGAPDAVLAILAALMLVLCFSPWLDITIGGVTLKNAVPWYVSPPAALIFVLLFVPCLPTQTPVSAAENELAHRFYWLREHLLADPMTVWGAQEGAHALDGSGGAFRSAEDQFRDKHMEPIIRAVKGLARYHDDVVLLRRLCGRLPNGGGPSDIVEQSLASDLRKEASKLPSRSAAQQDAAADAATRRD